MRSPDSTSSKQSSMKHSFRSRCHSRNNVLCISHNNSIHQNLSLIDQWHEASNLLSIDTLTSLNISVPFSGSTSRTIILLFLCAYVQSAKCRIDCRARAAPCRYSLFRLSRLSLLPVSGYSSCFLQSLICSVVTLCQKVTCSIRSLMIESHVINCLLS